MDVYFLDWAGRGNISYSLFVSEKIKQNDLWKQP